MANLKLSVLDVGHGDFIYLRTPKGQSLVIDCGPGDGDVSPAQFLINVHTIHELQISHPHTDHFGDLAVFANKTLCSFRCPSLDGFSDGDIGWRNQDKKTIALLRAFKKVLCTDDEAVPVGDGFNHAVWAPPGIDHSDPNTASLVTVLSYGDFKMLLCGDLPAPGMDALLDEPGFRKAIRGTNVLKAAHHGRQDGCCDTLFNLITPDLCIISDKSIDDSNADTVCTEWYAKRTRGLRWPDGTIRKVLTTRSDGSVHLQANGGTYWVCYRTTWKKEEFS